MLHCVIRELKLASPATQTYKVHPLIHPQEDQMNIRHFPPWSFRPEFLYISTDESLSSLQVYRPLHPLRELT